MRERTDTLHRKGSTMDLGPIIRVLEVPAAVPAETAPSGSPKREPAAPHTPAVQPVYSPVLVPAQTAGRASWAR